MAKVTEKQYEIQMLVHGTSEIMIVESTGEIVVDWEVGGIPGKLEFDVHKNATGSFFEGDRVALYIESFSKEEPFFYGYVFKKSRNKEQIISVTCYDQMRYLRNKDTYQHEEITYSKLLENICNDRLLEMGEIDKTEISIPAAIHDNKEYLEMLMDASDRTLIMGGELFVLFDRGGKINLKSVKNMVIDNYVIGYGNIGNYNYETSIDQGVYNFIKVDYIDNNNKVTPLTLYDEESIEKWGVLQFYAKDNTTPNLDEVMKEVLERVNKLNRKLTLDEVIGENRIRAGSIIRLYLPMLGDINLKDFFLVKKVTHHFSDGVHLMDLEIINNDFMEPVDLSNVFKYEEKQKETNTLGSGAMSYRPLVGEDIDIPSVAGNQQAFAEMIAPYAIDTYFLYGVLPSVTIAQGIIESTSGSSWLARNGKALFGIKYAGNDGGSRPQGMTFTNGSVAPDDGGTYRHYETYYDSIIDHGHFLRNNSRYADAFNKTTGAEQLAAIARAGYATDPNYYSALLPFINKYSHYDEMAKKGQGGSGMYKPGDSYQQFGGIQQQLVKTCEKYLGIPYVWGGTTPKGFDCSGLMQYVYRECGINISRVTTSQENEGIDVTGQELQPGDLIFWGNRGATYHVGMYAGNGKYIHSPQTGDVVRYATYKGCSVARRIV